MNVPIWNRDSVKSMTRASVRISLTCEQLICIHNMANIFYSPPKDGLSTRDIQLCTRCLRAMWEEGNTRRANNWCAGSERSIASHHQYWVKNLNIGSEILMNQIRADLKIEHMEYVPSWTKIGKIYAKVYMWGQNSPCNNLANIAYFPPKCALWVNINIASSDGVMCGPCNPVWSCPSRA